MRKLLCFLFALILVWTFPKRTLAYFTEEFNSNFNNPEAWNINPRSGSVNFTDSHIQLLRNVSAATSFPFIKNLTSTVPAVGEFNLEFKFNYLSVGNFGDGIAVTHQIPPLDLNLDPNHKNYIQFLIWQDPRGLQLYTTLCPTGNPGCSQSLRLLNGPATMIDLSEHTIRLNYNASGQYLLFFDDFNNPLYATAPNQTRPIGLWLGSPEKTNSTDLWSSFQIDYYKVWDPSSGTSDSLSVPDLKQYDSQWSQEVYDHAMSWSPANPTINKWGCALVSAAMVLNYFNHAINPSDLNAWLVSQNDGYLRNGSLNWLAISRYSKINNDSDSPNLEFTRAKVNNDLLDTSLADDKPVILGQAGHFVVAKGKTSDSHSINDPGYSDRPTLESYGNNYLSQGIYTPSNTDLSYIMLVVDEDVEIEVTNQNGDVVGDSYIEKITDPSDLNLSNEAVNTYMFAKPETGDYFVSLTGDGIYSLDAYLYDQNGNVIQESIDGIAGNEDQIKITVGEENQVEKIVTIDSILADLEQLFDMELVKKQAYKLIKNQLEQLKHLNLRPGKPYVVRVWKGVLIKQIQILSPKLISNEAEAVLVDDLRAL